jgi:hypothetical protein
VSTRIVAGAHRPTDRSLCYHATVDSAARPRPAGRSKPPQAVLEAASTPLEAIVGSSPANVQPKMIRLIWRHTTNIAPIATSADIRIQNAIEPSSTYRAIVSFQTEFHPTTAIVVPTQR